MDREWRGGRDWRSLTSVCVRRKQTELRVWIAGRKRGPRQSAPRNKLWATERCDPHSPQSRWLLLTFEEARVRNCCALFLPSESKAKHGQRAAALSADRPRVAQCAGALVSDQTDGELQCARPACGCGSSVGTVSVHLTVLSSRHCCCKLLRAHSAPKLYPHALSALHRSCVALTALCNASIANSSLSLSSTALQRHGTSVQGVPRRTRRIPLRPVVGTHRCRTLRAALTRVCTAAALTSAIVSRARERCHSHSHLAYMKDLEATVRPQRRTGLLP